MKKSLALLLFLAMCLSLAACGNQAPAPAPAAEAPAAAVAPAAAEAPAEPEAPAVEEPAALSLEGQTLLIYCGAGMQKPFQEIADAFQAETGCEMNVTYANAAQLQTQISESKQGAFFIAGSQEEVKPVADFVLDSTPLVKHIPVLAVAAGNPKEIKGIADLAREDVVTVIGDPESTPIGKIAMKAFADFEVKEKVNLAATTTTAPQLATVIGLGEADAAIIWKENCNAEGVEICETPDMASKRSAIVRAFFNESDDSSCIPIFAWT